MRRLTHWLVVLLLVFDHFGAGWHTHRHDSGVIGFVVAAAHSHEQAAEFHLGAPDDRSSWAHATVGMRVKAGPKLAAVGDNAPWPALFGPPGGLVRPVEPFVQLVIVVGKEPPRPAFRSLPPAPQAPPWRA